jgi:hypothetical protein
MESNSISAQSTPAIPSTTTRNTSYVSIPPDGETYLSYYICLDDDEAAAAFAEHRSTIQSSLQDTIIAQYFQLFHPQWPVLHQETFQRNPGDRTSLLSSFARVVAGRKSSKIGCSKSSLQGSLMEIRDEG